MLKKVFILHLSLFLLLSAVSFSQENKDKLTFILGGDLWISNSDGDRYGAYYRPWRCL